MFYSLVLKAKPSLYLIKAPELSASLYKTQFNVPSCALCQQQTYLCVCGFYKKYFSITSYYLVKGHLQLDQFA